MKTITFVVVLGLVAGAMGQGAPGAQDPKKTTTVDNTAAQKAADAERKSRLDRDKKRDEAIRQAESEGMEVRIKEVARFRGVRPNQLMGTGLVVGLGGTGDSKKSAITQSIVSNLFKELGINIDASQVDNKNVAAVMITAELPPFAANGQAIDVQVQSLGDAKSLVGGTLLQCPLYVAGDRTSPYAVAQGAVNLGGYDISAGGSSASKNFVTAGSVPGGALVERMAPAKMVHDGKIYLDIDNQDMTTATRIAAKLREVYPKYNPTATNSGTIELVIGDADPVQAMSQIEQVKVFVDSTGTIVINEKTGTIVIGGNVKVGPAVVVQGSISVRIDEEVLISQPNAFSQGQTATQTNTSLSVSESNATVATMAPTTTIADLARVFQAMKLKAADIISILKELKRQGALKARIISQ